MKNILVTGASGFVGRNLVEQFSGLPRYAGGYSIAAPSHRELDLADSECVAAYLKARRFDAVIHCAIKPGHRNAPDLTGLYYQNTRMFLNLLRGLDSCGKIIWLGSGLVYDLRHYRPLMDESYFGVHVPADEAGFGKYACARLTELSNNVIELRPFGVYGKYEDYAIRFISNAICKTLSGLPVTIRQNRKFDYISVDDLVSVIHHFINNDARHPAYNVASGRPVELAEIAKTVVELGGGNNGVRIAEPGLGVEYSGGNVRLLAELPGFEFKPLRAGIEQLFEYYRGNRYLIDPALLADDR
ncbi:MAG: NAD(P)-dependent oxidoreductase [Elusimicrobiaceae bacterium]|nr:NAD(P)-dependent oxidoreductase [Elusimicrobiaceae bacterium]